VEKCIHLAPNSIRVTYFLPKVEAYKILRHRQPEHYLGSIRNGFRSIEEPEGAISVAGLHREPATRNFRDVYVGEWNGQQLARQAEIADAEIPVLAFPGQSPKTQIVVPGSKAAVTHGGR
jgi:hypothetical protein